MLPKPPTRAAASIERVPLPSDALAGPKRSCVAPEPLLEVELKLWEYVSSRPPRLGALPRCLWASSGGGQAGESQGCLTPKLKAPSLLSLMLLLCASRSTPGVPELLHTSCRVPFSEDFSRTNCPAVRPLAVRAEIGQVPAPLAPVVRPPERP